MNILRRKKLNWVKLYTHSVGEYEENVNKNISAKMNVHMMIVDEQ